MNPRVPNASLAGFLRDLPEAVLKSPKLVCTAISAAARDLSEARVELLGSKVLARASTSTSVLLTQRALLPLDHTLNVKTTSANIDIRLSHHQGI